MKSLAAEGRTVFLSSHLMTELPQTADHLLVTGKGHIIADTGIETFIKGHAAATVRVRSLQPIELSGALIGRGATIDTAPDGAIIVSGLDTAAIGAVATTKAITLPEVAPQMASLEQAFFDLTNDDTEYRGALTTSTQGA